MKPSCITHREGIARVQKLAHCSGIYTARADENDWPCFQVQVGARISKRAELTPQAEANQSTCAMWRIPEVSRTLTVTANKRASCERACRPSKRRADQHLSMDVSVPACASTRAGIPASKCAYAHESMCAYEVCFSARRTRFRLKPAHQPHGHPFPLPR